ncbi:MAG: N-acetylneuraminate synthase family protein [Treponema sp.]|nr:N-acetylneuraminate synthase family protein [Treponema sp.]
MGIAGFHVQDRLYSSSDPLIIAELGTSHGGDPGKARALADAAAEAGANCIKFQIVYAEEILHQNTGEVALPGGRIRLYDRFKELETGPEFYAEMKHYVETLGLLFLCTPFGPRSAAELHALQPLLVKIASPELNYSELLQEISRWGLPVLLSSGVSKLGDIEAALEELASAPVCLLHCVTAYPAPERDYNLRLLPKLSSLFGRPVGVSDHSSDPELVPVLALSQGAAVIEKHFCLSREDPGLDDPIALPPGDFGLMVKALRRAAHEGAEETIARYSRERGEDPVEAVLGDGVKRLAPSEKANYERTNRSIHALRDIVPGEILSETGIAVLRTEKILRPGLPPSWKQRILGARAAAFIPAGEGIRLEDLLFQKKN